jgi:outer membrane protein TolC
MTLRIAATARRAYYRAVAAQALADFLTQAQASAEAAAAISKRLGESGTLNKLDQARNQAFSAELTAQLGTARLRMESEREALVRIMGLWGHDLSFRLPKALPRLPMRPRTLPRVEADAIRRRLDLQIARLELSAMAKSYGLTRATRFINVLDAGFKGKTARENGDAVREHGFDLELEVPLFDFGEVRAREAEETYMQAINRLVAKAVNVRSEARDAYHTYRGAYDIARHYRNEVLPLRRIISDETLLRYNAMQIDVFALLAEARQRINSSMAAIEAERDFWLAQTALDAAILGGNTSDADRPPVSGGVAIPDTQ